MRKIFFIISILFLSAQCASAQKYGQALIDSLFNRMPETKTDSAKANLLYEISKAYWYFDMPKGIDYANQSLQLAKQIGFKKGIVDSYYSLATLYLHQGNDSLSLNYSNKTLSAANEIQDKQRIADTYANFGFLYYLTGNLVKAQQSCYKALKLAEPIKYKACIVLAYTNLGSINSELGNEPEALKYDSIALKLAKEIDDKIEIAANYSNTGAIYATDGNYGKALPNFFEALKLNRQIGNRLWEAYNDDFIGTVYQSEGDNAEALKYSLASAELLRELNEKVKLSSTLNNVAGSYLNLHDYKNAKQTLEESIKLARETNFLDQLSSSYESLTSLDTATGNWKSALYNYRLFIQYRDSIVNKENTKKLVQTQMQYDFDKIETKTKAAQDKKDALALKELQKQKLIRNGFLGGFTLVLVFAGVFFTQRNKIKKGKERSDELLLNILPEEVAEELKANGETEARQFDEVTVMFTDFKNFTLISEKLSPRELVNEIHTCFKAFDNIITKYNIEKIKTIGDAYMCAGGLPVTNSTHSTDVVSAAIEIQGFMKQHLQQRRDEGKEIFEMRIGIHTGPVVAGIVGVKKFAYDIWGDTVNIASRMESGGETGKINISGTTYELVKDKFKCIYRGKVQAKNKGEIDMYFVETIS